MGSSKGWKRSYVDSRMKLDQVQCKESYSSCIEFPGLVEGVGEVIFDWGIFLVVERGVASEILQKPMRLAKAQMRNTSSNEVIEVHQGTRCKETLRRFLVACNGLFVTSLGRLSGLSLS